MQDPYIFEFDGKTEKSVTETQKQEVRALKRPKRVVSATGRPKRVVGATDRPKRVITKEALQAEIDELRRRTMSMMGIWQPYIDGINQ